VVVVCAGAGLELSKIVGSSDQFRIGALDGSGLGVLLGSAIGYVLGGVVGRLTGRSLLEAEEVLASRSAEQVLAGMLGAVLGVFLAVGLTWPLLLVGTLIVTLPIFVFICVTMGTFGYRIGLHRRRGLIALVGPSAGLKPPRTPASSLSQLLDTSVLIDGRIVDVVRAGFLHGIFLVTQPVLAELQGLADAGDDVRRSKGRHGLEVLESLRREVGADLEVIRDEAVEVPEVDGKLVRIALDREAALLTLDTNLARVAALAGCRVMNLHSLAVSLRPPVRAGDRATVLLTRPGKEAGQAVGYLDDGTMVVVERSRDRVGQELPVTITSVLTTANGRMIFARPAPGSADPELPAPVSPLVPAEAQPAPVGRVHRD
jgi:uncharacterized protein YacL